MYYKYSDYLQREYGEKVYKLPINLPLTCPNRLEGNGCTFCAENGTGFESCSSTSTVKQQLDHNRELIKNKYHADKYIAYFQNYTNTFMALDKFEMYMKEAASYQDIVEISISTRPDCINDAYLDVLASLKEHYHVNINIELGLQTVNYHTLKSMNRGHSLAEFIDAVLRINRYPFTICSHVILNLPEDTIEDAVETAKILSVLPIHIVKVHSLYIAKQSMLGVLYSRNEVSICSKEEYYNRLKQFLEHLRADIALERLFSRIPAKDALFSNWDTSWWKLKDEFELFMQKSDSFQGKCFNYTNGSGLSKGGYLVERKE
jgi:radical SAM protein (TIGR01212 family)